MSIDWTQAALGIPGPMVRSCCESCQSWAVVTEQGAPEAPRMLGEHVLSVVSAAALCLTTPVTLHPVVGTAEAARVDTSPRCPAWPKQNQSPRVAPRVAAAGVGTPETGLGVEPLLHHLPQCGLGQVTAPFGASVSPLKMKEIVVLTLQLVRMKQVNPLGLGQCRAAPTPLRPWGSGPG